jgi:hypothetical protein
VTEADLVARLQAAGLTVTAPERAQVLAVALYLRQAVALIRAAP